MEEQFVEVLSRIQAAALQSGRDKDAVSLVAVTKLQQPSKIQGYIDFCEKHSIPCYLGENYIQEWSQKKSHLTGKYYSHCIGHVQSNKIADAVRIFDTIETVDSTQQVQSVRKIVERMALPSPYPVWIQVNISQDVGKAGANADSVSKIVEEILLHSAITLKGLMTVTKLYEDPHDARVDFAEIFALSQRLTEQFALPIPLGTSMGMSDDFELAIQEGATHVRIGSALFGARQR